jgi:hypothetical protein
MQRNLALSLRDAGDRAGCRSANRQAAAIYEDLASKFPSRPLYAVESAARSRPWR